MKKYSELPYEVRQAQARAGITFDNSTAFIHEIEPKTEAQAILKEELKKLILMLGLREPEDRKARPRVLLVHGAEGRGKSYLCSGAVNEVIRAYYNIETDKKEPQYDRISGKAMYLTHYELDLMDKSCMNPKAERTQIEQYKKVGSVPFMVIDEIGRGSWSDYSARNLENVISKRYAELLPTVLITNKTIPEIVEMFDKATRDRLFNGRTGIAIDMDSNESESLR